MDTNRTKTIIGRIKGLAKSKVATTTILLVALCIPQLGSTLINKGKIDFGDFIGIVISSFIIIIVLATLLNVAKKVYNNIKIK